MNLKMILTDGMIVKLEDESLCLYCDNILTFVDKSRQNSWLHMNLYFDDLTSRLTRRYDIVKIYSPKSDIIDLDTTKNPFDMSHMDLVWQRQENIFD